MASVIPSRRVLDALDGVVGYACIFGENQPCVIGDPAKQYVDFTASPAAYATEAAT
jgi:hypothetical protein